MHLCIRGFFSKLTMKIANFSENLKKFSSKFEFSLISFKCFELFKNMSMFHILFLKGIALHKQQMNVVFPHNRVQSAKTRSTKTRILRKVLQIFRKICNFPKKYMIFKCLYLSEFINFFNFRHMVGKPRL